MELFDASKQYEGFKYPLGITRVYELGFCDMELWFFLESAFAEGYSMDLAKRYPERHLIPFAKRQDNDDVACFEIEKPGRVVIVHDFADPGWESREEYDDFWDWFAAAISQMIEWERKEEEVFAEEHERLQ